MEVWTTHTFLSKVYATLQYVVQVPITVIVLFPIFLFLFSCMNFLY